MTTNEPTTNTNEDVQGHSLHGHFTAPDAPESASGRFEPLAAPGEDVDGHYIKFGKFAESTTEESADDVEGHRTAGI